jgi:triphosphoribosyl-dephospho-CoA synthase
MTYPQVPVDKIGTRIAAAFKRACLAELAALKPGNVHIFAGGHRMQVADFEHSADLAAPYMAERGARLGTRILQAMRATMAGVGQNTNLGILLLAAPIAVAFERGGNLADGVASVLADLDRQDARDVFAAIRLANPGGLGGAPDHDVRLPSEVGLLDAMTAAAARDAIARQYVTGFADVIGRGLPVLVDMADPTAPDVVTRLYLTYLSAEPDTHIIRKWGMETAANVQKAAKTALFNLGHPESRAELLRLDSTWKAAGINPGTSADFTVATLFLRLLMSVR